MKFRKSNFVIQNVSNYYEEVSVVSGWIDTNETYGFYKYGKFWKATDLLSGTLICSCSTRKDCAEYIERNQCWLEEIRETQKYKIKVEDFRDKLKEVLNG